MQLVQVDMVGAEPVEGRREGAAGVGRSVVDAGAGAGLLVEDVAPLGGDDDVVPPLAQRPSEHPFTVSGAVGVRGVEEGDAEVEGAVHRPYGLLVVDLAPAEGPAVGVLPFAADRPASEAKSADLDAGATESACDLHA